MEQNNTPKNNSKNFYLLSGIWSTVIAVVALLVGIICGLAGKYFDVLFSFLIYLIFPTLCVFISSKITDFIFKVGKNGAKKGQIIGISIGLYMAKYLFLVIPLIVGLVVNFALQDNIFNPYALVIGALIYPLTSLIVQWYYVGVNKKKTPSVQQNG